MRMVKASFQLRMPEGVDEWVEGQAKRNRRSKNSEIVFRLEQAMAADATNAPQGAHQQRAEASRA